MIDWACGGRGGHRPSNGWDDMQRPTSRVSGMTEFGTLRASVASTVISNGACHLDDPVAMNPGPSPGGLAGFAD